MKDNWKKAFMDVAERFSYESYAQRLKVGSIVVKDNRIISIGINGMPSGWSNECETKLRPTEGELQRLIMKDDGSLAREYPYIDYEGRFRLTSKPEVLHAETNAISKLAKSQESGDGAAIFVTHAPCIDCAKSIYQAGIAEVYYRNDYRSFDGINFLLECGIPVEKIS